MGFIICFILGGFTYRTIFLNVETEEKYKQAKIQYFSIGKKHGIYIAHLQAKHFLKEFESDIRINYPRESFENHGYIVGAAYRPREVLYKANLIRTSM